MKAIQAKRLYTGSYFIEEAVLIWEDQYIVAVGHKNLLEKYNVTDIITTPYTIIPGFVDIQVNGAGTADFYGDGISEATLTQMSKTLASYGCTSFCPTLITSTDEHINKALNLVNSMDNLNQLGILGLHIEGPMFSQEHKGAHNPALIRVISEDLLAKICESEVAIVSLSPEVAPNEYISTLVDSGIHVSVAHTNATLEEVRKAESYGANLGTHLYNGMSRFNSREPNVVGALLTSKTMYSSIIPDGNHSDFESVKMAHTLLKDRLITITDGIIAMGTDMKTFKIGFQNVHIDELNRCIGDYGGLAGSMITPIECLQNLVWHCEYSLSEAISSYSSVPAKALELQDVIGSLVPYAFADFSILEESTLELKNTYQKGNLFQK